MGYIKHSIAAVVVDDYDTKGLEALRQFRAGMNPEYAKYLIEGPVGVNGTITFVFLPDGSKEGWDYSEEADDLREEFLNIGATKVKYADRLMVRFGGDDFYTEATVGKYSGRIVLKADDDDAEYSAEYLKEIG